MKVKIGDTIYDSNNQPIMIIYTDGDLKNMVRGHKYCSYPENDYRYPPEKVKKWMETEKTEVKPSETAEDLFLKVVGGIK
jgi:ribosome maturation protein Sdo1